MSDIAVTQLESAFYELFPESKSFYMGLKLLIANGSVEINDGDIREQDKEPEKSKYVSRASIRSKIFATISDNNTLMSSGDLIKKLQESNPDIKDSISHQLTYLRKEGMLVNFSPTGSKRDTYWGLRNWRDTEENFKEEYLPEILK